MPALFQVVVCTRNRPDRLERTLSALLEQEDDDFAVLVIDQSDEPNADLEAKAQGSERLTVVRDERRGLSRGRNLGSRIARAEWLAFIDDDCTTDVGWAGELRRALTTHPEVSFVSGHVSENSVDGSYGDYLPVSATPVREERVRRGRWTRPWEIGVGAFMAIRRTSIERLGGWDERLGSGAGDFSAADDMDFNYRLLRAGETAYATPGARVTHEQWRTREELGPLYHGYIASWAAFSMKHLRSGDVLGVCGSGSSAPVTSRACSRARCGDGRECGCGSRP